MRSIFAAALFAACALAQQGMNTAVTDVPTAPVEPTPAKGSQADTITKEYAARTLAGFFAELIYFNRLESLGDCFIGGKDTIDATVDFFKALKAEEFDVAIRKGIKVNNSIAGALQDCGQGSKEDITAITRWFYKKLGNKKLAVAAVSANSLLHP